MECTTKKHFWWWMLLSSVVGFTIGVVVGIPQHLDVEIGYSEEMGRDMQFITETFNCSLFDENAYFFGLARGCDVGCIDYDLRVHGQEWNVSEETYSVLNSSGYQECSAFCQKSYGRTNERD